MATWLNQQTDAKRMITCFCKCADVVHEVWPPGATACPLLTSTSDRGCSGDICCGAGTIYKDGKCVASYKGMKNACKDGGINGWKCESTTDDSCDHK